AWECQNDLAVLVREVQLPCCFETDVLNQLRRFHPCLAKPFLPASGHHHHSGSPAGDHQSWRCHSGSVSKRRPRESMKNHSIPTCLFLRLFLLALLSTINYPLSTSGQGTAFTYQGRLTEGGGT